MKKELYGFRMFHEAEQVCWGAVGSALVSNRAKSCQGRPFGLHGQLELESENGNPGSKYVARTG
jgi:hypothetical protein